MCNSVAHTAAKIAIPSNMSFCFNDDNLSADLVSAYKGRLTSFPPCLMLIEDNQKKEKKNRPFLLKFFTFFIRDIFFFVFFFFCLCAGVEILDINYASHLAAQTPGPLV